MLKRIVIILQMLAISGCEYSGAGCWERLNTLNNKMYLLLDTYQEISAAELEVLRTRIASSIRSCGENEPFYRDLSVVDIGHEAYYTLLDLP